MILNHDTKANFWASWHIATKENKQLDNRTKRTSWEDEHWLPTRFNNWQGTHSSIARPTSSFQQIKNVGEEGRETLSRQKTHPRQMPSSVMMYGGGACLMCECVTPFRVMNSGGTQTESSYPLSLIKNALRISLSPLSKPSRYWIESIPTAMNRYVPTQGGQCPFSLVPKWHYSHKTHCAVSFQNETLSCPE